MSHKQDSKDIQEAIRAISTAADDAVKTISQAAAAAKSVVSANAADAAKVLSVANSGDHDLLQRVDQKVDGLVTDVKTLNDGVTTKIADHETRIRLLETGLTKVMTFGSALIILVGIVEFFISKFVD